MVVKGKLIKARRQAKTFKGKEQEEKLYVTLSDVTLTKEQQEELKALQQVLLFRSRHLHRIIVRSPQRLTARLSQR